ncbi:DUF2631 domain-containing protein, partial [Streptomyces sp. SID10244]|nr:DUF2631 domain-containing protein [Streptomyces sp. SID10244]
QRGHIEDIYLVGIAIVLAYFLIRPSIRNRGRWKN